MIKSNKFSPRISTLEKILFAIQSRSDIALVICVVLIVAAIIMPMPTVLVDLFIACNMCMAMLLLMIAIYIPSPVAFSTFPSVLLLITMFRLALSITTTRLILLHADAGDIVTTFGDFVVGGNIVVGMVMFLIITIVQFLVVTKGAERVAEVSARFTLDGLPGKQMAIDADMRAGLIDLEQARSRRAILQKESALYGSLDGAMKFVKGDAIAGIFITLVNIFAGITVGVVQKGMDTGSAMELYTILTIGDGLVAQIPALVISITAGILVTRITSAGGSGNLGQEIGEQIFAQPMALKIAAIVMLFMGMIPGFPTMIFVLLALVIGGLGFLIQHLKVNQAREQGEFFEEMSSAARAQGGTPEDQLMNLSNVAPISLVLSASFQQKTNPVSLNQAFDKIRKSIFSDLGIKAPGVHLVYDNDIEDGHYQINLHDVPVEDSKISTTDIAVFGDTTQLEILGVEYEKGGVINNQKFAWVDGQQRETLHKNGIAFMTMSQFIGEKIREVLRNNASEFLGVQEAKRLIDQYIMQAPELIKEVTGVIPLPTIAEVLKKLLAEDVPIRNLLSILEGMLQICQETQDATALAEHVRKKLKRQISHRFSSNKELIAVLIAPDAEESIRSAVNESGDLSIAPDSGKKFVEQVVAFIGVAGDTIVRPVIIASADVRRYVKSIVENELGDMPVLSYQEITPDLTIKPLGRVSFNS